MLPCHTVWEHTWCVHIGKLTTGEFPGSNALKTRQAVTFPRNLKLEGMRYTYTAWDVGYKSQRMGGQLSPLQTNAKVKCKLHSQYEYFAP